MRSSGRVYIWFHFSLNVWLNLPGKPFGLGPFCQGVFGDKFSFLRRSKVTEDSALKGKFSSVYFL